ncbi:proline-rich proteoglycan 2-like [Pogoniulus pusillus]|uniref:proline-rich proteoglycan 2-like n=1 Tax=Pogoniulus pusillus TaxID=488313 RepID=UPI0030B98F1F
MLRAPRPRCRGREALVALERLCQQTRGTPGDRRGLLGPEMETQLRLQSSSAGQGGGRAKPARSTPGTLPKRKLRAAGRGQKRAPGAGAGRAAKPPQDSRQGLWGWHPPGLWVRFLGFFPSSKRQPKALPGGAWRSWQLLTLQFQEVPRYRAAWHGPGHRIAATQGGEETFKRSSSPTLKGSRRLFLPPPSPGWLLPSCSSQPRGRGQGTAPRRRPLDIPSRSPAQRRSQRRYATPPATPPPSGPADHVTHRVPPAGRRHLGEGAATSAPVPPRPRPSPPLGARLRPRPFRESGEGDPGPGEPRPWRTPALGGRAEAQAGELRHSQDGTGPRPGLSQDGAGAAYGGRELPLGCACACAARAAP